MGFILKKWLGYLLMPTPMCLFFIVLGTMLLWSKRGARWGRVIATFGVLLLLFFSNNYISMRLVHPLETRYPSVPELPAGQPLPPALAACKYVVVLGSGNGHVDAVSATNLLATSGLARATEAARLLHALPDAQLIVSGPGDEIHETHAAVLARAIGSLDAKPAKVYFIDQARDTEDESNAVKKIVGDAPFALVTSAWHMPRAMALFHYLGLKPLPCPCEFTGHDDGQFHIGNLLFDDGSLTRSTWAMRERIGYLWISLRGRGEKTP